jgi:protein gp37
MAEQSAIEWTDSTFNPWIGCTKVSPGCDNCYAECATPSRTLGVAWGPHAQRRRTSASTWAQPMRWERQHAEFFARHGRRRRVFCASLADVFDNAVSDDWRADLFALIESTPHLDWQLVTKRIGNVAGMVPYDWICPRRGWPSNVWLGITVVNQAEADRDAPKLLATPARVRFLSMEPLLGPVDLRRTVRPWGESGASAAMLSLISWVIVGGESGPKARPMHLQWARDLRDQCAAAGVPFLFKQWGEWLGAGSDASEVQRLAQVYGPTVRCRSLPDGDTAIHVGKKAAGRLLDGVEHTAFPT